MSVNSHARQFFVAFFFVPSQPSCCQQPVSTFCLSSVVGCPHGIFHHEFFSVAAAILETVRYGRERGHLTCATFWFTKLAPFFSRPKRCASVTWLNYSRPTVGSSAQQGGSQQQQKTIIKFGGVRLQGPRTFLCVCEPVNECTGRHKKALWTRLK